LQDLQEQAITDPLTGLLNRRYLREYLPRELTRVRRNGASLAVIMIDIDYFKRINDTFGHEAGDLVLRELGALLRSHIRASDLACRFGGEEFALVLPDASLEGAMQKAEAIRASVRGLDLKYRDQPLGPIAASFGVALFPLHADKPDSLLRAADEALYSAKGGGRDRVVVSETAATADIPGTTH
jgi:diguanylate cyclase (GGDEF)-like protein